jgi:DNA invertase Pin-like site-specific DNA recombinase
LEHQRESIDAAKENGKYQGRKPIEETQLQQVKTLVESGISISKAVSEASIGRHAYYQAIEEDRIELLFSLAAFFQKL